MATEQRVKKRRTLVKFAVQQTEYQAGKGSRTSWVPIKVKIGTDEEGHDVFTDCFYVEWMGSYGSIAIQQQADGVRSSARVRLPFIQTLYDVLNAKDVRIYKGGVCDDAHCFVLASSPNSILEERKLLEFHVKKYDVR